MSRDQLHRLGRGIILLTIVSFALLCATFVGAVLYEAYTHAPVILVVLMGLVVLSYLAGIVNDRYQLLDWIEDCP